MTTDTPLPPLTVIPPELVSTGDYEQQAAAHMSAQAWAYMSGGAADELTLADNLAAFRRQRLMPRVLNKLDKAHTRLELFGQTFDHPFFLAPVAYQRLAHTDGELATALGAAATGTGMVVSTQASTLIEDIAQAAPGKPWFQLYIQPDRPFTENLVRRAEASGYGALVLTVDAPVNGLRNREQRLRFSLPPYVNAVNLHGMARPDAPSSPSGNGPLFGSGLLHHAPTWNDLDWLTSLSKLPVIVKGILNPLDAQHAINAGAAGVIVSNHGGRTLDGLPATLDALPGIIDAIGNHIPVLLDGGIRRGTDAFKALALGAHAVLIGRPYIYGLAVAGASGVAHIIQILRSELEVAMALTGCPTLADITAAALWDR